MDLSKKFAMLSSEQRKLFYQGPAMKPPTGITPNFDNPPNQNALAYGLLITGAILSTMAVAVRLYAHIFAGKHILPKLQDYIVMGAWAIFVPWVYFCGGLIVSPGLYVHQWNVRYVDLVDFLYKFITDCAIYGAVVGLIKTAILLDWLHMFVPLPSQNTIAWTIHVVIALNCAYYTAGTLIFIFGCTPRKRLWDKTTPGTCVDIHAVAVASGVVNMVSDFIMFAIPQMVIWRLRLTGGKKAAISSIFAIGIFACVCAVARLTYSIKLFLNHKDVTYVMSPVGLWTVGEITSGFLLLGIPSLPRIIKEVRWVQSVSTWVRSLTGRWSKDTHSQSLPSWYKKPPTTDKGNSLYDELDGDERGITPAGCIARERRIDVHFSHPDPYKAIHTGHLGLGAARE